MIEAYYYIFDHKLKNTPIVVGLIGILIFMVALFFGGVENLYGNHIMRASILDIGLENTVNIGGENYRLVISKGEE